MASRRSMSSFSPTLKLNLPVVEEQDKLTDLAQKMLDKEHDLEKNCVPAVIHDLMAIYSAAIEYCCMKNDRKYIDFQSRMHKMLTNPKVLQALKQENTPSKTSPVSSSAQNNRKAPASPNKVSTEKISTPLPKITEESINDIDSETPCRSQIINEPFSASTCESQTLNSPKEDFSDSYPASKLPDKQPLDSKSSEKNSRRPSSQVLPQIKPVQHARSLRIIIDRQSSTTKDTASRAVADFKSQDSALERRLASRKKVQLSRSMTFSSFSQADLSRDFGCDLSDVDEENDRSTKDSCFVIEESEAEYCEKYEQMLEEIMEKNFGERALKVAEIKHSYETQISEISGMGDMMKVLVLQMRTNMQEEIDVVLHEYDEKRKHEIEILRNTKLV